MILFKRGNRNKRFINQIYNVYTLNERKSDEAFPASPAGGLRPKMDGGIFGRSKNFANKKSSGGANFLGEGKVCRKKEHRTY